MASQIRDFEPGDEQAFRTLNEAWLTKYFTVEPKDVELFADPVGQFITPGGAVLMLDADGRTIGCVALINMGGGSFEIAKMAVDEQHQGRGFGEMLMRAVIDRAVSLGAKRLFIETSSKLPVAIGLYRKLGFTDVAPETLAPSDYARADVFMERFVERNHWSRSDLTTHLRRMGIREGDVLIVHASLKSIGPVVGGPETVVEALAEAVGKRGTVLMPTFSDPQPDGVFRALTTPSRVGYLTEVFRRSPDVRRSLHPTHSVAALGPLADEVLAGHERISGLSADSPFHRAARHDAKILMVGCGMTSCSVVHVAESIERVRYLGRVWYEGYDRTLTVEPGNGPSITVTPKDPPTCSAAFGKVREQMGTLVRQVTLGDARCLLFRAADAIETARQMLRADPHALLCDHPRCPVCTAARRLA